MKSMNARFPQLIASLVSAGILYLRYTRSPSRSEAMPITRACSRKASGPRT